jgi:hypothetical protein
VALGLSTPIAFERAPGLPRQMMRGHPEEIAADLRQYQALGIQHFILNFRLDSVAGVQETMERVAREVIPLIPRE